MRVRAILASGAAFLLGMVGTAPFLLPAEELRPISSFLSIQEESARAVALFREAGKVLTHPRCVNCHPAGDRPLQADGMRPHEPLVERGSDGHGTPGQRCDTCHHAENYDWAKVPGHSNWHLAPGEMAWEGKSLGAICEQIKDRARNGGMDLEKLVHHMAEDGLVGWAWRPGAGRTPAPGTQAAFGALIRAWVDAGAHCPSR